MPRYGFRCKACEVEFEVSRSMSQAGEPAKCPHCGSDAERIFHMPMTAQRQTLDDSINTLQSMAKPGGGHGHSHGPGTAPHSH